jgi:hypothetical protein
VRRIFTKNDFHPSTGQAAHRCGETRTQAVTGAVWKRSMLKRFINEPAAT